MSSAYANLVRHYKQALGTCNSHSFSQLPQSFHPTELLQQLNAVNQALSTATTPDETLKQIQYLLLTIGHIQSALKAANIKDELPAELLPNTQTLFTALNITSNPSSSTSSPSSSSSSSTSTSTSSSASNEPPVWEQGVVAMKKYLTSYGVNYADCVEKSDFIRKCQEVAANPPPKVTPVEENDKKKKSNNSSVLKALVGDKLLSKNGVIKTDDVHGELVAFYFSAHWCPPCRQFTPVLASLYKSDLKNKGIEVIFVSSDSSEQEFNGYYNAEMPWLAIPFSNDSVRRKLNDKFSIDGIPALIVVDHSGRVISEDGRSDVMRYKSKVASKWLRD